MLTFKHNKKRNTAFLYETLMREGTKASLSKEFDKLNIIKNIIVEFFHPSKILGYELSLYQSLLSPEVEKDKSDKYLTEVKNRHYQLDKNILFNEQTKLINKINKSLGVHVYNNFVPYYKDLATISQIFNDSTPVKEKILLEESIISQFIDKKQQNNNLKHIDNIVYTTFVKKFNDKYSNLLNEQKELLTKYVSSFADEGLELKIFLNEEISRLNVKINEAMKHEDIKNDSRMLDKTNRLLEVLREFKVNKDLSPIMLQNLLKIQQFVKEVEV